jgi:lipopolysaccharide export system protein LptA
MIKQLLLLAIPMFLLSSEVEINAKKFEGDQESGISRFTGDVVATKGNDKITSDSMIVYTLKNNKIQKIEAISNAKFWITDKGKSYRGSADTIIYQPETKEYTLIGHGFLEYVEDKKKIYGDKIYINELTKKASVSGSDKPAKFIFYTDENKTAK